MAVADTTPATDQLRVPINLTLVRRVLVAAIVVLFAANVPAAAVASESDRFFFDHPVAKWFLLDAERNIPTLWACVQLAGVAGLAAVHALVSRVWRSGDAWGWLVIAGGFVYLTLDEGLQIHERLPVPDVDAVPWEPMFSWILLAAAAAACAAVALVPWLRRQPGPLVRAALIGGGLFLAGSLVLEGVGGVIVGQAGFGSPFYPVASSLEEVAELAGVAVFLMGVVRHLVDRLDGVAIRVTAGA